jgi:hypothetical protein
MSKAFTPPMGKVSLADEPHAGTSHHTSETTRSCAAHGFFDYQSFRMSVTTLCTWLRCVLHALVK